MLTEWYRGVKLPQWGADMQSFLTPSAGLLSTLLPKVVEVYYSNDIDTAVADRKRNRIVCGTSFLSANRGSRLNPTADKESAITFGLALIAHEGSHFAWSPWTIQELLKSGVQNNEYAGFVANIVEDIYIEDKFINKYPPMAWIIVGGWEYMFGGEMAASHSKWDGLTIDKNSLRDALNTFVSWKNQFRVFSTRSPLEQEFYDLFMSVRGLDELQSRKDLIERIVDKLKSAMPPEEQPLVGEVGNDEGFLSPTMESIPLKVKQGAASRAHDHTFVEFNAQQLVDISVENQKPVAVFDYGKHTAPLKTDKIWQRFSEIAGQRGAVRSVRGAAKSSGQRLTHPINVENGKVFSKANLSSTSGKINSAPPQVILLIDFSGSMRGLDKIKNALKAAYGAAEGMTAARISFAIYGYTSTSETTTIIRIKELNEHPSLAFNRISYLFYSKVPMNYTPDFEAISFASKKFESNGSDKVLIVISDGSPSHKKAGSSNSPVEDVRQLVNGLRGSGMHVFGLSIDSSADDSVKAIYGKDSMCSSDPNSINRFLMRFI